MNASLLLLLAGTLCAGALPAAPRASASYNIPTDTLDAGGRRSTSASYRHDGSLSSLIGFASAALPAASLKAGYIAQLYDITGLALTAASPTVAEGTTDQLAAWQALDDGTFLGVRANQVAWSVLGGPLSSIDGRGLVTADLVFANRMATVQGVFGGRTGSLDLTVLNVDIDNFGTYAGDQIDDAWQVRFYGLPPNANAGPQMDPLGSGHNNLFKYVAGLDPLDANSRFLLAAEPVPGQPQQKAITFSPRFSDRTYVVQFCTDLALGNWQLLPSAPPVDIGFERTVTDPSALPPRKFYRVLISKP